ncbi:MAG: PAS domain-containing protein [Desulfomonilia bacterium]
MVVRKRFIRKQQGAAPRLIQKTMRYASEELNALYSSASIGMCLFDAGMRVVRINDYLARIHGTPAADHMGRTLHEVAPHVAARAEAIVRAAIDTGRPAQGVWFSGSASSDPGTAVRLDGRCVPLKDAQGRVKAVSALVLDATARRFYGCALEEAGVCPSGTLENRDDIPVQALQDFGAGPDLLSKILDNIPVMILLFDSAGVIEYVSPSSQELSGYRREELIGRTARVFGDDVYESYRLVFDWVRTNKKAWSGRRTARRKTGEQVHVGASISPVFDDAGAVTDYVAVLKDITRETKLHQQLMQTQKLEAIGTLAGGIAHDLKNIFTPILINTELLLQDTGPESAAFPLLEDIFEAVKHGDELVNQIITFSRRDLQMKKPVVIAAVIRDALSFLRAALPSTIEMICRIVDDDAVIVADSSQIKQVIINLGTNAAYAMRGSGGTLELTLTRVSLDGSSVARIAPDLAAGSYAEITVRDTGEGMDEETLKRIFDPFFTTKDKSEGTGMGLSIVHGIVQDHKGIITVDSAPGKGSVFTILLPLAPENA